MKRKRKEEFSMPFTAAPVKIPEDIRPVLSKFSKSRTFPARQVQRSRIILLAADGLNNMQISARVGLSQDSVSKWRCRFLKNLPLLQEIARKDPSRLEEAVSAFLNDSPRPGQPSHYTDGQIVRILETACRSPEELGYEASHWSLNMLVDAVIKEGIVDTISAKTVSRFLKYGGNPPASRPLLASFLRENRLPGYLCGKSE
jgi:transposase